MWEGEACAEPYPGTNTRLGRSLALPSRTPAPTPGSAGASPSRVGFQHRHAARQELHPPWRAAVKSRKENGSAGASPSQADTLDYRRITGRSATSRTIRAFVFRDPLDRRFRWVAARFLGDSTLTDPGQSLVRA